jgi:hypothetical protein
MRRFKNNYKKNRNLQAQRRGGDRKPPKPAVVVKTNPAEELLKEWPELQSLGVERVRKWLDLRERLVEIAKVIRKYPWMVDVIRQRPMSTLHTRIRWRCMWRLTGRRLASL